MNRTLRLIAPVLAFAAAFVLVELYAMPSARAAGGTIVGKLGGKKKYVKNAIVYLTGVSTPAPGKKVEYDQKNQKFKPHVLGVVKGTTVAFKNNDATGHNVFSPDHEKYDLGTWPKGESRDYVFKKIGTYTQLCKLHPSMLGYIVVVPSKYFAKTGKKGKFKIKGVPAGSYTLKVWQERGAAKPVQVTVKDGGKTKIKIKMKRHK